MTKKNGTNAQGGNNEAERIQKEFEALPLEKKIASLLRMEAATLSESFDYAMKSPMKVFEKLGEALMNLGSKIEQEVKKAAEAAADETKSSTEPKKETGAKNPRKPAPRKPKPAA